MEWLIFFVKLEEDPPYIEKRYINKVKGSFLIFIVVVINCQDFQVKV